jgi:hypothetical protein
MFENMGKRKYAMPIVAVLAIFCVMSLVVYPILNATPKDIPFAILSLDDGAQTPAGEVNIGDELVKNISEGLPVAEGQESPIAFTVLDSQAALDEAMENNEYYGAIVIPADFSAGTVAAKQAEVQAALAQAQALQAAQAAAAQAAAAAAQAETPALDPAAVVAALAAAGINPANAMDDPAATAAALAAAGLDPQAAMAALAAASGAASPTDTQDAATEAADAAVSPAAANPLEALTGGSDDAVAAPSLTVLINQGKNAMVASTMQSALTSMFYTTGISAEFENVSTADIGGGAMAGMMSGQMLIMPFVMMTLVASMILFFTMRPAKGASRSAKYKAFASQAGYAALLSLVVAAAAVAIVTWFGGMNLPVGNAIVFLWIASFCMMLLFVGALDIAAPLGVLVVLLVFGCGMSIAMLAPEMLPSLWRDFVYPWVPQHFVGDGLRAIIYRGDGAVNASTPPLVLTGCVGLALLLLAGLIPGGKKQTTAE